MLQRYSNFLYNLSSKGKLPFELEVNESEVIVFCGIYFKFYTFLRYKGNRRLYESCEWSEQCTGTTGSMQCRLVEGVKMCHCQDGYSVFHGNCLKGNLNLQFIFFETRNSNVIKVLLHSFDPST